MHDLQKHLKAIETREETRSNVSHFFFSFTISSVQLKIFENMTSTKMTEAEFEAMLKTTLKRLSRKDSEIQSIIRDAQVPSSTILSASNVRSAVLACVSSDATVFDKISEYIKAEIRFDPHLFQILCR